MLVTSELLGCSAAGASLPSIAEPVSFMEDSIRLELIGPAEYLDLG